MAHCILTHTHEIFIFLPWLQDKEEQQTRILKESSEWKWKRSPRLAELQFRNGRKQREGRREGKRERQGRESPECKAMFSRNVRPPVLSCNLTGNSPEKCLLERATGREERRWIWWEGDGWRTRRVAQVITDHFSCLHNLKLCDPDRVGRYDDTRRVTRRSTFLFNCSLTV